MTNRNQKIDLYSNYRELDQFLAQFALDADFDKFNTTETIKEYNSASDEEYKKYHIVLSQANEILAMEPYPIDVVSDATGGLNTTKEWLLKALHLLKLRVTGKI